MAESAYLHGPVQGPPSSTVTQEGLAILMEVIGFASYPSRLRKLTKPHPGHHMAEEGADFLQVFEFYREQGFEMSESYGKPVGFSRVRCLTGCRSPRIAYLKGFIMVYNYIQWRAQGQAGAGAADVLWQEHP